MAKKMMRYSKTPKSVSLSSLGSKSYIYRISVEGAYDVRDVFIAKRKEGFDVVELQYDASLNQQTGKNDMIPMVIKTLQKFSTKQQAVDWQRKYIRENAMNYKRLK